MEVSFRGKDILQKRYLHPFLWLADYGNDGPQRIRISPRDPVLGEVKD